MIPTSNEVADQAVSSRPASLKKGQKTLADRLEESPGLYLFIFTVVYAVGMTANNARRNLWIDELFTTYLADLPSLSQIWPLIAKGIELNPPLPFWLTWIVHHTLGEGEVLTRLPATIGFWVMCVCLFYFVRRRSDAVHGFIALLLPLFTFTANDGTFARGYGLLLGFSGIALLGWQFAAEGVRRPLAIAGLAFGIAGAVSSHYYGVYIAAALFVGELLRARSNKRFDFPIAASIAIGLSPLIAYLPLIRMAKKSLPTFWADPLADLLYETYADLLGPITIVLFLFLLQTISRSKEGPNIVRWMPATIKLHETAVCGLLILMPLAVYAAAILDKAAFYPRYVQPVVLGFAILGALFAFRIGGGNPLFRKTAIEVLVWLCLTPWCFWQGAKVVFLARPGAYFLSKINFTTAPDLPLVIDNDSDFMSIYHYATPKMRERLFMLDDAAAAVKYRGSDTGMRSLEIGQTFHELHVVDYRKFVESHREFLVVRTRPASWMIQALMADGAQVELVDYRKGRGTTVDESLMFKIRVPERSSANLVDLRR